MRLGVFGGSFDPVHYGHLLLAEQCREQARLDEVWFVPAAVPPHKQQHTLAGDADRLHMLQLALGGHPAFHVSPLELERGGVSYTVDTLRAIHQQRPEADLFLLMGGDSLEDLPNWREPEAICQLAFPLVVGRPGSPPPDVAGLKAVLPADQRQAVQEAVVPMPLMELSSSQIRAACREGRSIRYQTPRAVEKYIESQKLYV